MTTVVVMPGGFHPFHAGHMALYNSARRVFPDAEVFVAATNDTSSRPFPFAIKEKLAKLAGVEPGHFVQVKSPFRAEEITAKFDPNKDTLIFVRSEKDAGSQPKPGGTKKDGSPAYLQPLLGAKQLEPFAKHAYMAYLPTVEFGPGMTSATQIRTAWPTLDERRKTALVMSLYPATQSNPKLAATVRKMLDTAIVGDSITESDEDFKWVAYDPNTKVIKKKFKTRFGALRFIEFNKNNLTVTTKDHWENTVNPTHSTNVIKNLVDPTASENSIEEKIKILTSRLKNLPKGSNRYKELKQQLDSIIQQGIDENQGWAATYTSEETRAYGGQQGAGMTAAYQRRENQPVDEDYLEEKWSERYKRSIDCSNPKGFSQRAHCAGRKK